MLASVLDIMDLIDQGVAVTVLGFVLSASVYFFRRWLKSMDLHDERYINHLNNTEQIMKDYHDSMKELTDKNHDAMIQAYKKCAEEKAETLQVLKLLSSNLDAIQRTLMISKG